MENLTSLRSLDVSGGPSGTGRPTSPVPGTPRGDFEADLAQVRRGERREERRELARGRVEERRSDRTERRREASQARESEAGERREATEPTTPALETPDAPAPEAVRGAQGPEAAPERAAQAAETPGGETGRGAGAAVEALPAPDLAPNPSTLLPATGLGAPAPAAAPAPGAAAAPTASAAPAGDAGTALRPTAEAADGGEPGPGEGQARPAARPEGPEAARAGESARPAAEPAPSAADGRQAPGAPRAVEAARSPAQSPPPAPPAGAPDAAEHAAAILNQVRLRMLPGAREATLQLEPARLGRLSIRLELRRGVTRAEVVVDEAATLEVLARHEPELRAALADAGFQGVEVELRQAGDGELGRRHAERGRPSGAHAPRREAPPGELVRAVAARLAPNQGVDTYA